MSSRLDVSSFSSSSAIVRAAAGLVAQTAPRATAPRKERFMREGEAAITSLFVS
jgi:hypothetical protein